MGEIGASLSPNKIFKIELAHPGQEIQGCEKSPNLVNALIFSYRKQIAINFIHVYTVYIRYKQT